MLVLALASATSVRAEESPEARAALDRLTAFMGGERVLSLRTLVVAGDNRRDTGHGFVDVPTRTYLAFPLSIRQEIVLGGRTLAMAATSGGGTAFTADGADPLPEAARIGLERTGLRNPVSLVKSRLGRDFSASIVGAEAIDGRPADVVRARKFDVETDLVIDRADGRLLETRYTVESDGKPRRIVVQHDDWREVAGLRYPFRSTGREEGRASFELKASRVEVDVPLAAELFVGPWNVQGGR